MTLNKCINEPIRSLEELSNWNYPASVNVTIPLKLCSGLWDSKYLLML